MWKNKIELSNIYQTLLYNMNNSVYLFSVVIQNECYMMLFFFYLQWMQKRIV